MNRYDNDDRDWDDDYEPEPDAKPVSNRTLATCAAWVAAFIAAMTYLVRRYA